MTLTIASDKYYVVVGLGMTGMSVVRYLSRKHMRFCAMDSRAQPPGLEEMQKHFPEVPLYLEKFDRELLLNAEAIVLSPGVAREQADIAAAIAEGVKITSDIELFLSEVNCRVVGVTGSNGKSTVVTLLGEVAKAAGIKAIVAGNIGVPVLDLLGQEAELFVLELSSFQLENIKTPALDVACVLNVSPDHMDRHGSMEGYFKAKQRIYFGAKAVVYNLDDRLTVPPVVGKVKRAGFALNKKVEENEIQFWFEAASKSLMRGQTVLMSYSDMRIKGLHNVANALAVFAIAEFIGIRVDTAKTELSRFAGLPHRCQWVAEKNAITFVNDSKATNVGAAEAAVLGLKDEYKKIILIAGGDGKGADFGSFGKIIREHIAALVLIGRDADKIAKAAGSEVAIYNAVSMRAAVELAFQLAEGGTLVLLSPACASFDMFNGYEARGREFVAAVEGLCA